ncbi:hypothetical protein CkaCkLH20_10579 [Colletotrichum karsti]|uniref:Uncharacterized protein n=1 Tax=Colletotrichum karsti TaxID=1095194 RepID=A0A9P6HVJ2_9PEZI|nr:uncharacterized protein CkaCkLH20_10579 [Colletotrichum karsti]KAF9871947.1 hypothetical protein CkaCkLH20_10579 [Colletotrichum karsti]
MTGISYSTRPGPIGLPKRFGLLLLWLLLHAGLASCEYESGNTLRPYAKRLSARADPTYESRVEKGKTIKCDFSKPADKVSQSKWQDAAALERWGWYDPATDWTGGDPLFADSLDKAFADVKIDKKNNGYSTYTHIKSFTKSDGTPGQARIHLLINQRQTRLTGKQGTGGEYGQMVNPTDGAIVFDGNFSPSYFNKEFGAGDVPELEKLSDVSFFQWVAACDEKKISAGNIKYAFRAHITYQPSFDIVTKALQNADYQKVPDWDKRATFTMDQDSGLGILGSVHGSGVAFFLLQHKAKLGLKRITEVTVWSSTGEFDFGVDPEDNWLNLRFKIENVE